MTHKATKSFKKFWNAVTRLILTVVTLVTIIYVTCFIGSFGVKIVGTQLRMAHYHSEIQDFEAERDYCHDIALKATNAEQKRVYQKQADNADEKIEKNLEARKALHDSSDRVVAFAAENDFNFVKLLIGISELLVTALLVMILYKFFVQIINVEKKIFDFTLKIVFFAIGFVFFAVAKVCFGIARFFSSPKKQTAPEEK